MSNFGFEKFNKREVQAESKPVSKMTKAELLDLANQREISVDGRMTVKELREVLR